MDPLDLLDESELEAICIHARERFPDECCGMILRSGVKTCGNAQDRLHALDPLAFPQRAQRAFAFEARDALFLAESMDSEDPVLAIYHSHTNGRPGFSKRDRAALLWNGRVAYPELRHWVIDCRADGVHGVCLFGVRGGSAHEMARVSGRRISNARRHPLEHLGPPAACPAPATR